MMDVLYTLPSGKTFWRATGQITDMSHLNIGDEIDDGLGGIIKVGRNKDGSKRLTRYLVRKDGLQD